MYDFDKEWNRMGTGSIKWTKQNSFGVPSGLLPFWIADTDFGTLPEIIEAIQTRLRHPMVGYSDYETSCLEAIQGWYERRHQWKVPMEAMLMGAGVVTSIRFTLQALTQVGDQVLIFTPVYDPFFEVIRNTGRVIVECPLVSYEERYTISYELLEQQLQKGVKAILLCNPHNPVGRVWSYEELEQLATLCEKYQVYILSDEVHGDLTLYDNHYVTMGKFEKVYEKLVIYTAISKTFNMAGLVSSCMMIRNKDLKDTIEKALADAWIFGPNALAFPAIEAAYIHGDRWVDEQNAYLSSNATFVQNYFKEYMPEVKVTKIEGTFLMWLDLRVLGMGSDELTKLMAEKYGIALGNGVHYGEQADGFMRLNIGCTRKNLEKGLDLIYQLYSHIRGGKVNE